MAGTRKFAGNPSDDVTYRFRDLLALEPLSADELTFLLDQSKPFQEIQRHPLKKLATLRGKTVALAFFENSTRTRISFATAASRLGADHDESAGGIVQPEKRRIAARYRAHAEAMRPDGMVMRHAASGAAEFVARNLDIPVLNAGDGTHEHPTQALLDALTIRDRKRHDRRSESDDTGRHSAQPRGAFEYSSAGKIRLRVHVVRAGDVGAASELEKIGPPGTVIRRVFAHRGRRWKART